jgi:hypothetical protein
VPIDVCYELVGRIRRAWRGFQGGDDVMREIDLFFERIVDRTGRRGSVTQPVVAILDARPAGATAAPAVTFRARIATEGDRVHRAR